MIFASFRTVTILWWRLSGAGSLREREGFHTLTELEVPENRELHPQGRKGVVSLEPTCLLPTSPALPLAWHPPFEPLCSLGGTQIREGVGIQEQRAAARTYRCVHLCAPVCVHTCSGGISPCS